MSEQSELNRRIAMLEGYQADFKLWFGLYIYQLIAPDGSIVRSTIPDKPDKSIERVWTFLPDYCNDLNATLPKLAEAGVSVEIENYGERVFVYRRQANGNGGEHFSGAHAATLPEAVARCYLAHLEAKASGG